MSITTDFFANYLGKPASTMLTDTPFKDWTFENSFENDLKLINYVFPHNGMDFVCDEDDKITTIFLYSDESRHFEAELKDVPFSSTRQEVIECLGAPSKSGHKITDPILGVCGAWDRFGKHGYTIHVEYGVSDVDCIKTITLMRADVVPA